MPWRPSVEGERPTLGWLVYDWIVSNCVVPDGEMRGDPFVPSEAQTEFLLNYYMLHEDADKRVASDERQRPSRAFVFPRGGLLVQPQKAGKSPFAAAVALAEAAGPVRFSGWSADGQPVGVSWPTPLVVITAQSEDQASNVWDALLPMVELSSLHFDIPDTGITRINLPDGGEIVPVTASAKSRQGARATFVVQDEVQSWDRQNKGIKLADTQYRSLAGMGGRFMQICNAWDPAEDTVAQQTWERGVGVYKQMSEAGPGNIRNARELDRMLKRVYKGSGHVDLERIKDEIAQYIKDGATANAERYFLNRIVPAEDHAFDVQRWRGLAKEGYRPDKGAQIVVGVDGARYRDALAMIATEIATGFQWPLSIMERPENAADDYEHDFNEADGVLIDAMNDYDVWRVYVDPGSQYANIQPLMERWQGRWGDKRVIEWLMNRPRAACYMIRNYASAIQTGDVAHDGDPTFTAHIFNARRRLTTVLDDDGRPMHTIQKEHPQSHRKIDAAAAGALSWEARGDAMAAGTTGLSSYEDPRITCRECNHIRRHHAEKGCRICERPICQMCGHKEVYHIASWDQAALAETGSACRRCGCTGYAQRPCPVFVERTEDEVRDLMKGRIEVA